MKKQLLSSITALFSASILMAQLPVSQTAENKNVVLEEFTGIYCTFCPDGHRIANDIKTANPNDVVLINIHVGSFATPTGNDPNFTTPFGTAIVGQTDLQGYPAGTVNRHLFSGFSQSGGSGTAQGRATWDTTSTTTLGEAAYANVALESSINIQTRVLTVNVQVYYTDSGAATNNLNVALLQNNIEGPQTGSASNSSQVLPNGQYNHNHMLRHLLTGQWGDTITTTTQGTLIQRTYTYTIPANLNNIAYELGNLEVVAFLVEGQQEVVTGANGPLNFVLPAGSVLADLSSSTNMEYPSTYCDHSITPRIVVINNNDSNSVSSYEVSYSLNGGTPVTQTVSTALAAGDTAVTTFPGITLNPSTNKENKLTYSVSIPTGTSYVELVTSNNTSVSNTIYVFPTVASSQTLVEGFENTPTTDVATSNTISINPNDITSFVIDNTLISSLTQKLGGFGNSDKSYFWDFYTALNGTNSTLVFEKIDLSSGSGHGMKFNHAYAQYSSENDRLDVLISTDCGVTWTNIFSKAGSNLATSPPVGNNTRFFPTVEQWASNFVDLSSYSGQSDVMVAFRGTSNYGNSLFVDDIKILGGDAISVEENELSDAVSVYPNPSNGNSTIALDLNEQADVTVLIYNSLGKLVISNSPQNLSSGTSNINLNLSDLDNGVYFAHVTVGNNKVVKQITLLK